MRLPARGWSHFTGVEAMMWQNFPMWSVTQKVTLDPRSGRPEAPLYWRLTTFFVIAAWCFTVILGAYAMLALRDGAPALAVIFALSAVILLAIVYRRKAQIRREQREFAKLVADYEKAIAQAPF